MVVLKNVSNFTNFYLGLALASLLTVQNDIIHERFSGIILNICETLNDIMVEDECTGQMTE